MRMPHSCLRSAALTATLAAFFACGQTAIAAPTLNVTVLSTSDLHGHILPMDYFNGGKDPGGLAQIATYVKEVRSQNPYTVLVDNGDTLEGGNSTLPIHYSQTPTLPNPMALAMNTLRYDSMEVGNHEFNYGPALLSKFKNEVTFPVLGANVVGNDGKPALTPYVIKDFGQVQVGIVGVVTPNIPNWEKPENIKGLSFTDPVAAAKKYVAEAKAKGADVVVVTAHTGTESQPTDTKDLGNWMKAGLYQPNGSDYENFGIRLANGNLGADAIVLGHAHNVMPEVTKLPGVINDDVVLSEPGSWGDYITRLDFTLEAAGNDWKVVSKKAQLVTIKDQAEDPAVSAVAKSYHDATMSYLSQPLGTSKGTFTNGLAARTYDSAIIELINRAQMALTGADLSCSALFSETSAINKGDVLVKDIYGLYIYPNTLYKIEITGAILKAALEQDCTYWNQYNGQKTVTDLVNPNARGYNWDVYTGVDYTIDLSKPVGQRVTSLKYKGKDVQADQKFTLAVNNYRAGGGGGFAMFKDCPVLWKSEAEMREIMRDYVKASPNLDPAALEDGSFTLLPAAIKTLPIK